MSTAYDHVSINSKAGTISGFPADAPKRPIVIDAASRDPLAATPTTTLPAGTALGQVTGGKWKPVRRTLVHTGETASGWDKVLGVDETTMFAVGDIVQLVNVASPSSATNVNLGAITDIVPGTSITVTNGLSGDLVAHEWYVEVTESAGDTKETCVVLSEAVDLLGADGVAVDTPANGYFSGGPIDADSINFSAAGPDARLKTALALCLIVDDV